MDAHDELKVRPPGEIANGLDDPVEHARKGVGAVEDLGVPENVRESRNGRLGEVDAVLGGERIELLLRSLLIADPVLGARAAGRHIVVERRLQPAVPAQRRPDVDRLGHEREMVGVVMAEDEAAGAIGDVPGDDPGIVLAGQLDDQPLGHVDAVMRHADIVALGLEQPVDGGRRDQGRGQIAPPDGIGVGLAVQRPAGEIAQRPGPGVHADADAQMFMGVELGLRQVVCELAERLALGRRDEASERLQRQPHIPPHGGGRLVTGAAERPCRTVRDEMVVIRPPVHLTAQAGGQDPVAQESVDPCLAQGQRDRERAVEGVGDEVRADAGGDQHLRSIGSLARRGPAVGVGPHERAPVGQAAETAPELHVQEADGPHERFRLQGVAQGNGSKGADWRRKLPRNRRQFKTLALGPVDIHVVDVHRP